MCFGYKNLFIFSQENGQKSVSIFIVLIKKSFNRKVTRFKKIGYIFILESREK